MSSSTPSVVCTALGLTWPDGGVALDALDLALPAGRTGVVGTNGSGKSTLLRLVSGELAPTSGSVSVAGDVALLPQRTPPTAGLHVADLLGVARRLRALRAIETGDPDPAHFAVLGDDWDVEARAHAALARVGVLDGVDGVLDRPAGTLSGGELVLTRVAGLLLRQAAVTLLDEPTNNLDRRARALLCDVIDDWSGVLVVVSHDRDLLERMDQIAELRDGTARVFTGPYSAYVAAVEAEQQAAARRVRVAEGEVARERRQAVETEVKLARRQRFADRAEREKRVPKIIAHARRGQAEVSAGKYRDLARGRLADARAALSEAEDAVRDDRSIRVDLPATAVPSGRQVLAVGTLLVRGPERVALSGPNGAGKSTLLDAVAGRRAHPLPGVGTPLVPFAYLPQRAGVLDDAASVLDNLRRHAPQLTPNEARAGLARFRLRGADVEQLAATLSGGERLRVALACLLLADPAPQLLLLDEPTNDLDLDSLQRLTEALRGFRGALLVVSHDERFLADIGVTRRWEVRDVGLPSEARVA